MLDHHIQRTIVYKLAFAEGLRFSDLKPGILDNKLFTYHLKKVVTAGLVSKLPDGNYALTPEGRRLGVHVLDKRLSAVDKPESVAFLAIRRKTDKAWLLYSRKTHPLFGRLGFMHCFPDLGSDITQVARRTCKAQTGIDASFRVLGSGYFRVFEGDMLESFTHFEFLLSDDAAGELEQNNEFASYFWADDPDFLGNNMLPNMKTLGNLHKENKPFFIEKSFQISADSALS